MVMRKLSILLLPALLVGCASVPAPLPEEKSVDLRHSVIEKIDQMVEISTPITVIEAVTSTPPAPETQHESPPVAAMMPAPPEQELLLEKPVKKTTPKFKDVIIEVATSVIEGKSETITYDANGDVKEKTVIIEKGSLVENITKLLGLITATIGLYLGVRQFRHPPQEKAGA